jgi:SAM-dependent methyltransferase
MSEVWNKVFFNHMKTNNVKKVLELGAGHGRDTIFFASNGIEVEALDYSVIAVEILEKIAKEKRLPIKSQNFDVKKNPLPFPDGYFDSVYSHMFLNMRFSLDEIRFIFSEIGRVLKSKGLNFFSVRNHNDKSYGQGMEIDKGIYDINGFQIRFFTEKEIQDLAVVQGFEILWIKEEYEEPVTLYLVPSRKT